MKWVQFLAVLTATAASTSAQIIGGSGSGFGSLQPIRACQDRLYGCAIFETRAVCDPHPNCTWVNRRCQNNTAIQCALLTTEGTCNLVDSCEWMGGDEDSFCGEASCNARQSPVSCNTFYCNWNGTFCEDQLLGSGSSGIVEPTFDPVGSGGSGLPGSGSGSGFINPSDEPDFLPPICEFDNETACTSDSRCAWTTLSGGSGGGTGEQGFCSEILCSSFENESSCNAFNINQCHWSEGSCFDNFLMLTPDESPCFRIVNATTCNATTGCFYDSITTAGHCRGPCSTQRDPQYCSVGCIRSYEGESLCVDVDEASCSLFNEDSCPSNRCAFRETLFRCPFLTCGRGSPCAERHVCSTEGFHSPQCCTAMQQYCNSTNADMACIDTTVISEMQDRFNCTIASNDGLVPGSECHDRVPDEATCQNISGCTWRSFADGSGLEGSGAGSGLPSGFCDSILCSDFTAQASCESNNCTWADEICILTAIDGSGLLPGSGSGSSEGSGFGTAPPIQGSGNGTSTMLCTSYDTQNSCISPCEWIEETVSLPGSGSGMVNSTQSYCVEPGCWTQQTEAGCNAYSGSSCVWASSFCIESEVDPSDVVPTEFSCIFQPNSTSCGASGDCVWDQDLGMCNPFTCGIIGTQTECSNEQDCEWFTSSGSGGIDIAYCIESIVDVPTVPTEATSCFLYYSESECNGATTINCTWFDGFCSPTSCRTQTTQSSCTGLDSVCVWYESTYDGYVCGNSSEVINVDPVELVDCERFSNRNRCLSRNFCTWVDGGPGCKEVDSATCEPELPSCYEYTDFVMCNQNPNCYFSSTDGNFFCAEQTTPAPPTEPPLPPIQVLCPQDRPVWYPETEYYPGIYLGRVGLFTCTQVYIQAPLRNIPTEDILSDLRENCCNQPTTTAAPSSTEPTQVPTATGVTTPPPSAPTAAPTVEGGTDITITFGTAILRRFTDIQKLSFEFQIENAVSTLAQIPRRRILRIILSNNPDGAGMIAKVFFDGSVSILTAANVQASIVNSPISVTIEGTNNAAGTYRSGAVVVDSRTFRPTPSPVTIAPTFPSGTRAPASAPTMPLNDAAASGDDDKSIEDNLMIIIIVIAVVSVALVAFVVYTRSKRSSSPGMIRPTHHSNPVYQKGPAPDNGMGPAAPANGPGSAPKGMVRVESMC